jgi:hypothetical protein
MSGTPPLSFLIFRDGQAARAIADREERGSIPQPEKRRCSATGAFPSGNGRFRACLGGLRACSPRLLSHETPQSASQYVKFHVSFADYARLLGRVNIVDVTGIVVAASAGIQGLRSWNTILHFDGVLRNLQGCWSDYGDAKHLTMILLLSAIAYGAR